MPVKGYKAHKALHQDGGSDELDVTGLSGLLADDQHVLDAEAVAAAKTVKLDDFAAPDDNTDLNATNARHGLLLKLIDDTTKFLRSDGGWQVPAGGGPTIVRKTADEAVNNSNVLQNDDHLLLAIAANEVWLVELTLLLQGVSPNADFKCGWAYPVGCTIKWGYLARDSTTSEGSGWMPSGLYSVTPIAISIETDVLNTGLLNGISGAVYRAIVINGANAGTLNFQWAQNTATAENTKVLANSCLIAHELS